MLLFVGLGNPGPRYAGNRHNIGFMALEAIARRHDIAPWRASAFKASAAEGDDRQRAGAAADAAAPS